MGKAVTMGKLVLIIIFSSVNIFAQGITLSQDSLKIYNNFSSSIAETITITNGSQELVWADSIHLIIHEIDTTEWVGQIIGEGLEASWRDYIDQSCGFFWNAEMITEPSALISTPAPLR